ncbi:hypothetical protein [Actinosynnema sp.]|uniref:hypothetical protein n=1 Tax=Actinosynnema sp. TaxID=1872144 RepID=UPI003F8592CA
MAEASRLEAAGSTDSFTHRFRLRRATDTPRTEDTPVSETTSPQPTTSTPPPTPTPTEEVTSAHSTPVDARPRPTIRERGSRAGGFAFSALLRVVLSGVVGAGLCAAWIAAHQAGLLHRALGEASASLPDFLLLLFVGLPLALVASALLAGPLLWLLGVRPAWPIVLLGPVVLAVAHYFDMPNLLAGTGDQWVVLAILAGLSYALAGLLTIPTMLMRSRSA